MGDIRVTKPEPVEIVGAHSADSLRFICFEQYPETNPPWKATVVGFNGWNPTLTFPNVKEIPPGVPSSAPGTTVYQRPTQSDIDAAKIDSSFSHIDFSNNYFSFLKPFEYIGSPPGMRYGLYKVLPYFDYPGVGPDSQEVPITIYEEGSPRDTTWVTPGWNDTYFGSGPHAGANENFPNTAYVHIYKTTHETFTDSITVIQYFYFYPYNHWWNRHEGDWQRIHVVASSRDSTTAEIMGVEYLFHKAHFSYYNDYRLMPDITSDFVFNPRENIKLIQGRHPVVYVGPGSHAAYPTGGDFLVY